VLDTILAIASDVLLPIYLLIVGFLLSLILKESKALDSALITSSLACVTMILLALHTLTSDPTVRITTELPILLGTSDLLRTFTLSLDELSAFFILVLGVVGLASSIYGIAYVKRYLGVESLKFYSLVYTLFLLSMYLVLVSSDLVLFIISWELMTITAFFLISFERTSEVARRAALKYLLMSYSGSGLIIMSLLVLYLLSGSTSFTSLKGLTLDPTTQYLLMLLLTVGFGIKAALVPMHNWLPDAHPEAPSNVSALLSGFMIKTAVYGMLRFTVDLLRLDYHVLGLILASLGVISSVYGTSMALLQIDSKKLMAYSSVGQIGYVFLGVGGGLALYPNPLSIIALSAGLFHVLNHAVFKGLLFLTTGSVIYRVGSRDLNILGGLARHMPTTFVSGLIASLSISGIPPLNGFVSKWLIIISLLLSNNSILTVYASLAIFASALTLSTFMKYLSRTYLSSPNTRLSNVKDVPLPMIAAQLFLAILCILLGVLPYIPLKLILRVTTTITSINLSLVNVLMTNIFNIMTYFALLLIAIAVSLVTTIYVLKSKTKLVQLWTFGTRDLLPVRLGLNATSYYTEFEHTYSFSYRFRTYTYRFIIDPLTSKFMSFVKAYDNVDTYLYIMLLVITAFLTALITLVVVV
jgi:hydrogenase-4 component B